MRTIHKLPIYPEAGEQVCNLPVGAIVRHDEQQRNVPTIWIEVDTEAAFSPEKTVFFCVGTGHPIPQGAEYVGTAQCGLLVWHIMRKLT